MEYNQQPKRLSVAHLKLFVAVLIQNKIVFKHFIDKLAVDHFPDEMFQLLYRVVIDFYKEMTELPSLVEIEAELAAAYEADEFIVSDDEKEELDEFISWAFDSSTWGTVDLPDGAKLERFAFKAGKKLLQQANSIALIRDIAAVADLDQLPALLLQAQAQAEIVNLLGEQKARSFTFPGGWDKSKPFMVCSTGLGFFDKYMSGGSVSGEVYGLMAPYGTCKTTLAVMLWCTAAQQCYEATFVDNWDGRKGMTVLVSYEAALQPEIQHRALMYAAQISRTSLSNMGLDGVDALMNDPDAPLPYEQKKFHQQISDGLFEPERVRLEKSIIWMNDHTLCLDMSGSDTLNPAAGNGGVAEIVSRIASELRVRGPEWYVKSVIVDYVGLMVDRDSTVDRTRKQGIEDHKIYQQAVGIVVKTISKHYDCHTWLMHQLSGAANAQLSVTKTLHHTDAKGSKSFAENLDYAFCVGNLNMDNMGQMACTKARRSSRIPPSILRVDGEFNTVLSPDNFHVDVHGKIIDESTMAAVGLNASAASTDSFDGIMNNLYPTIGDTGEGEINEQQ